jgi:hypothetical protein
MLVKTLLRAPKKGSIRLEFGQKKPDFPLLEQPHGNPVFVVQLRQPGYPEHSGPVAFRPLITQSLALSVSLFLLYTMSKFFARKKFHPSFPGGKLGLQFSFQRARDPDDSAFSVDEGVEGRTRDQMDCICLS